MNNALFDASKELLALRFVKVGKRQAGSLAGSSVSFREERDEATITVFRVRMTKLEFAPLRIAVSLPALFITSERQNVRPAKRLFTPADRLRHGFPHGNDDRRQNQVVSRGDQILS